MKRPFHPSHDLKSFLDRNSPPVFTTLIDQSVQAIHRMHDRGRAGNFVLFKSEWIARPAPIFVVEVRDIQNHPHNHGIKTPVLSEVQRADLRMALHDFTLVGLQTSFKHDNIMNLGMDLPAVVKRGRQGNVAGFLV